MKQYKNSRYTRVCDSRIRNTTLSHTQAAIQHQTRDQLDNYAFASSSRSLASATAASTPATATHVSSRCTLQHHHVDVAVLGLAASERGRAIDQRVGARGWRSRASVPERALGAKAPLTAHRTIGRAPQVHRQAMGANQDGTASARRS